MSGNERGQKGASITNPPLRPRLSDSTEPNVIYTPADVRVPFDEVLGSAGVPPFTRGIQAEMYRTKLWTMRQYSGFGTPRESNKRLHYLLDRGQTGLSIAFDLPTQMGRDSDHALARGEIGRVGVSISTIDDMRELLDGIPLESISTSMTINATAPVLLCLYVAVAEEKKLSSGQLRGTVQNDILKEYIARGTYIYPPTASLRLTRDLFGWASQHTPKWNPISVSGYHMREAGCTAAQEVAFTFANAICYMEEALRAGLAADEFGGRISFFFAAHSHFLEEVAKFRAARRLWESLMRTRFGVKSERARALRFHVQTAGSTLQAQQPLVNTVRVAIQALSAVFGGCQSLHTNAYDEALALPTEESAALALRTQQVIAYETGAADIVDGLGGAYALEALTDRVEREARSYLARIDEMGGMVAAIEQGYVQREIQNAAYLVQQEIERQERVVVGVNAFTNSDETAAVLSSNVVDDAHRERLEQLRAFRASRNKNAVNDVLRRLQNAAMGDDNVMPILMDALKTRATLGEVSDCLRNAFGEYAPHANLT